MTSGQQRRAVVTGEQRPEYALERAVAQHPGARPCAAVDAAGKFCCPYPLDPALGADTVFHPWCDPATARQLVAVRLAESRRQSQIARTALADAQHDRGAAA